MNEFLEELKKYLEVCVSSDSDFTAAKTPTILDGYQIQHTPSSTRPEIQVQPMSNGENVNFTTFCGKKCNTIPVQITVYTGQVKIGKDMKSARDASLIIADKVEGYLYNYIYSATNPNLYYGRQMSSSPAMPMKVASATIYATALRYTFNVAYPYVEG